MELENLMQQLNSDNDEKHPISFENIDAKRRTKKPKRKMGMERVEGSMFDA
jgi:hypothetical protein